jgi:hypothetical protein
MKRDPECESCPTFDDHAFNQILEWAEAKFGAKVQWNDEFVDIEGKSRKIPALAHWAMTWKFGHIGFDQYQSLDNEQSARKAAALFIYLFCQGVEARFADRCASAYVDHVTVYKVN